MDRAKRIAVRDLVAWAVLWLGVAAVSYGQGVITPRPQPLDAGLTNLASGSDHVRFVGPAAVLRSYTLPDQDATLLYSGGPLGTPSAATLTNATGLPIGGLTGLGTGVASALAGNVTGSDGIVLATGPTMAGVLRHLHTETLADDNRTEASEFYYTASPVSAPGSAVDYHGMDVLLRTGNDNSNANTRLYPFESTAEHARSTTIAQLVGGFVQWVNSGAGTVTSARSLRVWGKNESTGTVTDAYAIHIQNPANSGGGVITNNHAIHIDAQTAGADNWGLYSLAPVYAASLTLGSPLAVAQGGTGAATLTGLVKGNGTSAMSAAVAGTDYAPPNTPAFTGVLTHTHTETSYDDNRTEASKLYYLATPSSAPASAVDYHGADVRLDTGGANTNANTRLYALEATAQHSQSSTIGGLIPGFVQWVNAGTGGVTLARSLRVWGQNESTGTVATAYGIQIQNPENNGGGVITANYALYIEAQTTGGTNYGVYSLAANNAFAGLAVQGASNPTATLLDVNTALAPAPAHLLGTVRFDGSDQSANTAGAYAAIKGLALDSNANVQGSIGEAGRLDFAVYRHDSNGAPRVEYTPLSLSYDAATITGGLTVTGAAISFANLPTSEPATPGQLWNDGGVVTVSDGP